MSHDRSAELSSAQRARDDAAYEQLRDKIDSIVDAAIESDILNQGFRPSSGEGEYYLSPGVWLRADGTLYDVDRGVIPDLAGWSPGERRLHFERAVTDAFAGWDRLPDATASRSALHAAGKASDAMAIAVSVDAHDQYTIRAGNRSFADAVSAVLALRGFFGHAMGELNATLTNRLPSVTQAQYAALSALGVALQAEQGVWRHARHDVVRVADEAIDAMRNANTYTGNGGHHGGFPDWLKVTAAVAGAAAVFFSGGVATALGGVSTEVRALTTFSDAGEESVPRPLGAGTPDAVLAKLVSALDDLGRAVLEAENHIASGCLRARSAIERDPGAYSLTHSRILGSEAVGDYLRHQETTSFALETLHDIARTSLPAVATNLTHVADTLATAVDPAAFDRPAGIGGDPYPQFAALHGAIDACLQDTAWTVQQTGEQLELFARDFEALDEGRAAELRRIRRRIHRHVVADRAGSGHRLADPATPEPIGSARPA